jgi:hypothetical protein
MTERFIPPTDSRPPYGDWPRAGLQGLVSGCLVGIAVAVTVFVVTSSAISFLIVPIIGGAGYMVRIPPTEKDMSCRGTKRVLW